jgi:hypothetical protein
MLPRPFAALIFGAAIATPSPALLAALDAPVTLNARAGVAAELQFFANISGRSIVAGQQEIAWDESRADEDVDYLVEKTGRTPGLRGFDFLKYVESSASRAGQQSTERAIAWARAGGLVAYCCHLFVDIGSTNGTPQFYTPGSNGNPVGTNFDIRQAVISGTPENTEFLAKLDIIAAELTKLRDAGVTVIWRPFHEAGGTWFWWSAHGAEPFKAAWKIMFDRFTRQHQLDNLIWCFNPVDSTTVMTTWYPGDDLVDMISLDVYPPAGTHPTYSADFRRMRDFKMGRKVVVMSENGAIPDIDPLFAEGGGWSYFCTWNGFENDLSRNSVAFLDTVFNHEKVLTLDEVPSAYARYARPFLIDTPEAAVTPGANVSLTANAAGEAATAAEWTRNGASVSGGLTPTLTLTNVQPADAGLYVASTSGGLASAPAILGISSTSKVAGLGRELQPANILHPIGNIYDQVLLEGAGASVTADPIQVTRTSFIDLDGDIVQVEFSGAGTLTIVLDEASGPALPAKYNQDVLYMQGRAGIVITGANETSNVSVFSVGRASAFDPTGVYSFLRPLSETNNPADNGSPLFTGRETTAYDGFADIAFIAITSPTGTFGGIRTGNTRYSARKGYTGIYAPGVEITGPMRVHDIIASDDAIPAVLVGSALQPLEVAGGSLEQDNDRPIQVSGGFYVLFTDGSDSHGHIAPGHLPPIQTIFIQNGVDITSQIVGTPPQ